MLSRSSNSVRSLDADDLAAMQTEGFLAVHKTLRLLFIAILMSVSQPLPSWAALVVDSAAVAPGSMAVGVATVVTVTAVVNEPSVLPDGVNLQRLDTAGRVVSILGLLHDDGANGDAVAGDRTFTLRATLFEQSPGPVTLKVSAAFRGAIMRASSAPLTVNVLGGTSTGITISSPADLAYLNTTPTIVNGTVGDAAATVTVNGVPAVVSGNSFQASVPLVEGTNTLEAVASNSGGTTSTSSAQVTLDTTAPHLTIEAPADGLATVDATTTVSGLINDIVVGTVNSQQATVTVNGIAAQVANRSFAALNVPLALGPNTIQAIGRDRAGNSVTTTVHVNRVPATTPAIRIVSGNNQTAPVSSSVANPLVISLTNGVGQPVANTPVVFRVTDNNGLVTSGGSTAASVATQTDGNGRAQVALRLGSRAGAGGNRVEASATGFTGVAAFTATGTPTGASLITVDSGLNQTAALATKLAFPFVVVVTDAGFNRLGGVPVSFTVKQGGGTVNGRTTLSLTTDPDGRAAAFLTVGTEPGLDNNVVEASFAGNPGQVAVFTASAKTPGNAADTKVTGVVLDNSNNPIEGVTVRLFQPYRGNNNNTPILVGTPVKTNAQGQFVMAPAPVGFFKLMADGTTVDSTRGVFPTLEYEIVTVAGQDNNLGMPLLLPVLDTVNRLCVNEQTGGTLTLPEVPGFSLTVVAGSATFPGGARSGCITVSTVNADKSPMTPGFGQQPRFLITIQPVGTMFNPPAPLTMPNVDGLQPNQVTELYSYDHDLAAFTAIGTGTVSEDGLLIESDPGVGILKAGWHCGGNPNSSAAVAPLTVTIAPTSVEKVMEKEFSVVAKGTPPLDGFYTWELIVNGADEDIGVAALVQSPRCSNQTSCTAVVRGVKPGRITLRVHFHCITTGAEVTTDSKISITTKDVVVISWIDAGAITLPAGASILLRVDLNTPLICSALLLDWLIGIPTDLFGDAEVAYANAFLLKNSGNSRPPTTIDPEAMLAGGDFRMFNRLQATFTQAGGTIANFRAIKSTAVVGTTPDPCGLVPNAAGEEHPSNGANGVTHSGNGVFQLAEGRLGSLGQRVNSTINGRTTPFVWSVIRFESSGALAPLDHAIFPTYAVYVDGNLTATYPQSDPAEFISKDDTYQRLPSQIP